MPRAIGANSKLHMATEASYGTPPAGNWRLMPFVSCDLGAEQPFIDADVIGLAPNRDVAPPFRDIITVQGQAVVPVDLAFIGDWLRLLLGAPTTTGTATATFGLIGQGSTRSATSSAGTPTTRAYVAFNKAQGSVRRNGTLLGQLTGGRLSYTNSAEIVRTIRDDRRIEGVDPGLARATGQITSRFADTLLLDDAAGNAALEIAFEYRISPTRRLTVTLHETYLALAKTPIQGPAGIEASFGFRSAFNAAAGRMMTVTLRNDVASYA